MIRFENVGKVFSNGYIGLQDVSFSVEPGTLNYLVGESGAGKTTLMRLLIRDILPTEGEIYIDEEPISSIKSKHIPFLRRKVAVVFQDYKLLGERTIQENVSLALEIIGASKTDQLKETMDVLDLVGLADKKDMFPTQLSGGELQRIAIARALAMRPKVLFADEPTGNLDPVTGSSIGQLLHTIAGYGTTVIVATHDQSLLKNLPARELHLRRGKLIEDKPAKKEKEKEQKKKKEDKEQKEKETV
jgi:cell division transport system ATP-binding protein